ncbi:MAG: CoB--CoM heterodisulfide reductase iron-sulfur subunit A family protein [Thermoplasmata archaeon]|nr:CoB--CoM heterodisulfide reductase iron-sulfur subunit A family protein [Thermoplasmata archaeon]
MPETMLVIGGGVAGIQASLDLAERGTLVHLVEKTPSLGGRMAQLDKTFPTNDCSICILAPKMAECYGHPNINVMTYSEVQEVSGSVGNFTVVVLKKARYVDESLCTGCGICSEKCPKKVPNEFEMGLGMRKAIYRPFPQAVPPTHTIDRENCIYFKTGKCKACEKFCEAGAIDFEMEDQLLEVEVGAVIVATGYDVWDPTEAPEYGYGKYPNVYTSLQFERLMNASGPTKGHVQRRSDEKEPKTVAFIQCVGARNAQLGHPYCCSVCCMYATKESMLMKEHGDIKCTIFYKDLRAFGKGFYEYVERARTDYDVEYVNSDATVERETENGNLIVAYDVEGKRATKEFDMVILAACLIPRRDAPELAKILGIDTDEYHFFEVTDRILKPLDTKVDGIFVAGYCQSPVDIPEAVAQGSGAAARASEVAGERPKAVEAVREAIT